jgi:DNA primase catalytic subunit
MDLKTYYREFFPVDVVVASLSIHIDLNKREFTKNLTHRYKSVNNVLEMHALVADGPDRLDVGAGWENPPISAEKRGKIQGNELRLDIDEWDRCEVCVLNRKQGVKTICAHCWAHDMSERGNKVYQHLQNVWNFEKISVGYTGGQGIHLICSDSFVISQEDRDKIFKDTQEACNVTLDENVVKQDHLCRVVYSVNSAAKRVYVPINPQDMSKIPFVSLSDSKHQLQESIASSKKWWVVE